MRIAIDMDEVLADTHGAKMRLFRDMGYDWSEADIAGRRLSDIASPEHAADVEAELQKGLIFASLDVMNDAVETVEALGRDHEIFIATAAMEYPASCAHKVAWLRTHFPFIDPLRIVLCGDKSIVAADVLIDDSPRHFETFCGTGVCFGAPHNHGVDVMHRLASWRDAPDLIARLSRDAG